jgi:hypothetical protein
MNDFFTWSTVGTLTGAVAAVVVVTTTARKLTNLDTLWIPFAVSVLISGGLSFAADELWSVSGIALALLNACLLFCTALGLNDTTIQEVKRATDPSAQPHGARKVEWFQTWLRRTEEKPSATGAGRIVGA